MTFNAFPLMMHDRSVSVGRESALIGRESALICVEQRFLCRAYLRFRW
ncbi:hypothetical protein ACFS27_08275 [Promicromonospora vindobonensis]|uniref:Uncharacterized protein n=1 Tax=Promicromonospora vindobonensis TaxID=195748 RepID=A0ABW5VPB3_9MICO